MDYEGDKMKISEQLRNIVKQAEEAMEEIYENFEEMKNRIEELELQEKQEQEQKTIYNLEKGDTYWFIDGFIPFLTFWKDNSTDIAQLTHGNIYLTEQDAKDELRARKLIAKAKESQRGFVPDWGDGEQRKYYIYYSFEYLELIYHYKYFTVTMPMLGYWESDEDVKEFIKENEDELTWFFKEYKGW